jgi:multidrug efflux pump subunit AcrA (membrane-fusion protein)
MTKGRGSWTWIAVVALASLAGCGLHGKPKVERRSAPAAASAARAHAAPPSPAPAEAPEPDTVVSPGIVEPWGGEVELSAQEPGWIARIAVKEGDAVEAGQLLATLEDAAQRRSVDLAGADLAEAEAALARIEHGPTAEELRQARAEHAAAEARGDLARSAAARTARLHERGAVPDSEADRSQAESRALAAEAERAEARLAELERGARVEDKRAARARVEAARARLELAQANLARRRIVAPGAGTVLLSRFHAGEFYGVGAGPLVVLGDMSRLQVRLEVDEIDAQSLEGGAPCRLYSDAGVRLADGAIVRLAPKMGRRALAIESPTARSDVRVREVFVEIPATSKLVPGQRVWGHASRAATARAPASAPSREG